MQKARAILCLMIMLFIPFFAFSIEISAGGKLGGNSGWFSGNGWNDELSSLGGNNEVRLGVTAGGFLNVELTRGFSIQPELLFSSIKGGFSYTEMGTSFDATQSSMVVELPVFLMPRFAAGSGEIRLFAGPEIGFIIGDVNAHVEGGGLSLEMGEAPDNRVVFGIAAGIGYAYPLGSGSVVADLKYSHSFTEVFDGDDTFFNGIGVLAGYSLNL